MVIAGATSADISCAHSQPNKVGGFLRRVLNTVSTAQISLLYFKQLPYAVKPGFASQCLAVPPGCAKRRSGENRCDPFATLVHYRPKGALYGALPTQTRRGINKVIGLPYET